MCVAGWSSVDKRYYFAACTCQPANDISNLKCSKIEVISSKAIYFTAGACQPANEIKLVSVPDMGYLVTDDPPRGHFSFIYTHTHTHTHTHT